MDILSRFSEFFELGNWTNSYQKLSVYKLKSLNGKIIKFSVLNSEMYDVWEKLFAFL